MDELKAKDSASLKDEDLLSQMRAQKAAADEFDGHNRESFEDSLRFLEGHGQWDEKVKAARALQGRPCLTINKLPQFVAQVANDIRMNRPRIKVKPVDSGADPEVAEIMEGLVRNIEYSSRADVAYDTASFYAVAGGRGFILVETCYADDDAFDQDIRIRRVQNPLTVYIDPDSQEADGSDMSWAMISRLMPKKQFKKKHPEAEANSIESDDNSEWFTNDSVRLAEYWTRECVPRKLALLDDGTVVDADKVPEGAAVVRERESQRYKVMYHLCSGAEVLERKEWPGKYIPIVPVWGEEININGKVYRRGLIHNAKDSQRMYNYWRTTATELVALAPKAPTLLTQRQIDGHEDDWDESINTPKPYLIYNNDASAPMPQRLEPASVPQGVFSEAQVCVDDMKATTGIYDASLGQRSNENSGVAIRQREAQGDTATFVYTDNLSRAIAQVGRIIIDLIPTIYDTKRIVRVLGEDGKDEAVTINEPTANERLLNDLTVGKYDVQVESGPSFGTKRQEAAETMMEMMKSFPGAGPLLGDLIARNMDWPDADKVADRLKAMLPPEIKALEEETDLPPQIAQMMEQMKAQLQQMAEQNAELQAAAQSKEQEEAYKAGELDIKRQELALKGYELWLKAQQEDAKREAEESKNDQDTAIQVAELTMAYREDMMQIIGPIFERIQAQHNELMEGITQPMPLPAGDDMPVEPPEPSMDDQIKMRMLAVAESL